MDNLDELLYSLDLAPTGYHLLRSLPNFSDGVN